MVQDGVRFQRLVRTAIHHPESAASDDLRIVEARLSQPRHNRRPRIAQRP